MQRWGCDTSALSWNRKLSKSHRLSLWSHYTVQTWKPLPHFMQNRSPPVKMPKGFCEKKRHSNNKCVVNHYLLARQCLVVCFKTLPSGLDMPNREVDVTSWPLPKHGEVEGQRSELVSALSPYLVGHVWFWLCPGALISMTPYAVKYPALYSLHILFLRTKTSLKLNYV